MAKRSGIGQQFYFHGVDMSGDVGSLSSMSTPRGTQDITGIDKNAHEFILTQSDGSFAWECFFNKEAGGTHLTLGALPSTDVHIMWMVGETLGDRTFCAIVKEIDYAPARNADGSLNISVTAQLSAGSPGDWCRMLASKTTHASESDETGHLVDSGGSQTSQGGVGYLQHFSAASGTVEYDLEDSLNSADGDDGDWVNLGAFEDVATPYTATAQRLEVTGDVEKYVRISTNGTFTTAVFAAAFRRGTAQDIVDLS